MNIKEKNNWSCSICGEEYFLCLSCSAYKANPWKLYSNTIEHYKVHQIITGYKNKIYTKQEAKEKFLELNIADYKSFKPEIVAIIDEFMIDTVNMNNMNKVNKVLTKPRKKRDVVTD